MNGFKVDGKWAIMWSMRLERRLNVRSQGGVAEAPIRLLVWYTEEKALAVGEEEPLSSILLRVGDGVSDCSLQVWVPSLFGKWVLRTCR